MWAWVLSFMDMSEQIRAYEMATSACQNLKKANEELKHMQSQMVQSEKMAAIGQLAAGVAHELNTPVGFVASNFETLCSYLDRIHQLLGAYESLAQHVWTSECSCRPEVSDIRRLKERLKDRIYIGRYEEPFM